MVSHEQMRHILHESIMINHSTKQWFIRIIIDIPLPF